MAVPVWTESTEPKADAHDRGINQRLRVSYCDLFEHVMVVNVKSPLLRIVHRTMTWNRSTTASSTLRLIPCRKVLQYSHHHGDVIGGRNVRVD